MRIGSVNSVSSPHLSPTRDARPCATPAERALPADTVTFGASAAAAPSTPAAPTRNLIKSLTVGLALAASMMGMTGCASMHATTQLPNVQQMVTGQTAKSAYSSLSYLDSLSAEKGGGIFDGKTETQYRLSPLDAVDRMMDGKTLVFSPSKDGKSHPIRSWAELKGLDEMFRQQQQQQPAPARVPQVLQQH